MKMQVEIIGQTIGRVSWHEVNYMETRVKHTTETIGGKTYPLTITKQIGLQEIIIDGKPTMVTEVTIFESPLGTSHCRTLARSEAPPEVRAANLQQIKEVATKAMIDMGIW